MSIELFAGILRMLPLPWEGEILLTPQYVSHPGLSQLRQRYSLEKIAGEGDDFAKALRLLGWLSSRIYHKGDYDGSLQDSLSLLSYALDQGPERGINCCSLSTVLTECCLSLRIPARTVYLMPLSPYDGDNHVVCEVWDSLRAQWTMLDPTYGGYLTGEDERPLGVYELRQRLANRQRVGFSKGFNYNGAFELDFADILAYYAKNLFYLKVKQLQTFGSEQGVSQNATLVFVPHGYDPKASASVNIDYRISEWGSSPAMERWRESLFSEPLVRCPARLLQMPPEKMAR